MPKSQAWYDAIRAANSKPRTEEHRKKLGDARRGKSLKFSDPEERARKISEAQKGKIFTPEHAAALVEGRRNSKVWKIAVSEANTRTKKGKPIIFSNPEARAKAISEGLGRPETRAIVSQKRKEMWANRTEEEKKAIAEKSSATQKARGLTPEHLTNIRKANSHPMSEEHRSNVSKALKGRKVWNTGLTKETHPSIQSMTDKQIGRIPNYKKYRVWYHGPKGDIYMRSKWEVAYAEHLDLNDIDWQYEPRFFVVGSGDWHTHTYTPDFYLTEIDEYHEIKGRMSVQDEKKIAKFKELFPDIKLTVIGGEELFELGMLDKHGRVIECPVITVDTQL